MDAPGRPIIVGGCHRSGTSLLRRMLDAHSRIHCGPEVPFFRDFFGDYRDDPLGHLRFSTTARSILPEAELLEVMGRAFVETHERAARHAGKERWADKSPDNVLYTDEWDRLLGSGWILVHVVRNPLDTLASMVDRPFPLTLPPDTEGRAEHYRRYTDAGLAFARRAPDRCHLLVYEDLVGSAPRVLDELMGWLGEEAEPRQLDFNSVPHQEGLEDPEVVRTSEIHRERIGCWRRSLDRSEATRVWAATGESWRRIDPELSRVDPP